MAKALYIHWPFCLAKCPYCDFNSHVGPSVDHGRWARALAAELDDRPVVVDFTVHQDAMVWPMVPAGTSNDEIKSARDLAPQFDEGDL